MQLRSNRLGSQNSAGMRAHSVPRASARLSDVPLPVAALLITMLVPRELEFYLGVALTFQRLVLLVFLPIAFARLFMSRDLSVRSFDVLIISAFAYFWFTLFFKETLDKALQSGSSQFIEAVGGYLIARVYIRSSIQFRATVHLLFILVLISGAAAAVEAISHTNWVKEISRTISGAAPLWVYDTRLGLRRASASFDHPIHYGVFCAGVFGLVWFLERDFFKRILCAGCVGAALFFSLSAAPLIGMCLIIVGALWEHFTSVFPNRVWFTIGGAAALYLLASAFSDRSPTRILSTSLAFDADNAYYRLAIWEYGTANVAQHPWIGVPLGTWERPDWMYSSTVDHYWLLTAMHGGVPALVLYVLAIATLLRAVHLRRSGHEPLERRECRYAWSSAVLVLCFVGMTVAFWREIEVFFVFCLGMGAWLADGRRPAGVGASRDRTIRPLTLQARKPDRY